MGLRWRKQVNTNDATPEQVMETIEKKTMEITAVVELAGAKGWQVIKDVLLEEADSLERRIVNLAANPIDNANKLRMRWAERRALVGLISLVEGMVTNAPQNYQELENNYRRILEIQQNLSTMPKTTGRMK